ncbi:MAG TPA: hypothetical protein VHK01_11565 [Lacipirellulaceae bacterium]|jgi:hypothetical protein|nr:hypothetical protein [Lacipirellulaceae bacterium]
MSLAQHSGFITSDQKGSIDSVRIRDWVAVMALQGILAAEGVSKLGHRDSQKALATVAYSMADAMIEASNLRSA